MVRSPVFGSNLISHIRADHLGGLCDNPNHRLRQVGDAVQNPLSCILRRYSRLSAGPDVGQLCPDVVTIFGRAISIPVGAARVEFTTCRTLDGIPRPHILNQAIPRRYRIGDCFWSNNLLYAVCVTLLA